MEFKEKLKELRKQKNLSQEELADQIGVSRQAITKWETGKGLPDIENMKMLAQVFHITLDDLVCQEKETDARMHTSYSETIYDIDQEQRQFDIDLGSANSIVICISKDEKLHIELMSDELDHLDYLFKVKLDERKACLDVVCLNKEKLSKEELKRTLSIKVALPQQFTRHCEVSASAQNLKLQGLCLEQLEFDGDVASIEMEQCTGNFDFTGKSDYEMLVDRINGTIAITQWKANCLFHIPAASPFQVRNEGRKCKVFCAQEELDTDKGCTDCLKITGYKAELTIDLY